MLAYKTLKLSVKSLKEFAKKRLPDEVLIELDERDECPIEIVRDMCSPDKLGIQLLFIPEEFGGMGGGTFDVYCICEEMARIDLGVATSVLATFLGSDPITVGATPEQKKTLAQPDCRRRLALRLRRHRTGSWQRSGRASHHGRPRHARRAHRRLQDQRQQTVDQQWRNRRCLHGFGQHASRAELVRRGKRCQGIYSRRARRQARHSPEQHSGTRVQRGLR